MDLQQGADLLYVLDPGNDAVLKYDVSNPTSPTLENFSALGSPAITAYDDDGNGGTPDVPLSNLAHIAVDDSGGPNDGTIYVATASGGFGGPPGKLLAFDPSGDFLYEIFFQGNSLTASGIATVDSGDRAGDLYATYYGGFSYTGPDHLHFVDQSGGAAPVYEEATSFKNGSPGVMAIADAGETIYGPPNLSAIGADGSDKFTLRTGFGSTPAGLATDPNGGRLYVAGSPGFFGPPTGTAVEEYSGATEEPPGKLQDSFGADAVGVAVHSASSTVYTSDNVAHEIDVYVPGEVPDLTVGTSSFDSLTSAELTGSVNPLGATVSTCEFQYGTTTSYGQSVLCDPANLGNGEDPVDVSGIATGLTGGTLYHYRLKVTNADGTNVSEDATYFAPNLPEATTAEAGPTGARSGSVLLGGTVDANKTPTEWWIEYGIESDLSDGQSAPAGEDLEAGDGVDPIDVNHKVSGLQPETTYYFRAVAATKAGRAEGVIRSFETPARPAPDPSDCPNAEFRPSGSPSAALPNCRAYERVTPVDTNGGSAVTGYGTTTADGNRVVYASETAYAGQQSLGLDGAYVAERGPGGWTSQGVQPPVRWHGAGGLAFGKYKPQAVDAELDDFYLSTTNMAVPGVSDSGNSLAHRAPDGEWSVLATRSGFAPVVPREGWVLTTSEASIATTEGPQPPAGSESLYEINDDKSVVRLVNVDEQGDAIDASVQMPNATGFQAISDDGSRIFFKTTEEGFPGIPSLWVRIDGQESKELTESEVAPAPTITQANFQGATPDGRFAFFTANAALTAGATATSSSHDLYRFDVEGGDLVDLTTTDPNGAGVKGAVGFSDDGQIVYVQATGNLTPDASGGGEKIYRIDADGISLVAKDIEGPSLPDIGFNKANYLPTHNKQGAVSPDGRYLLFASSARYDVFDPNGSREYYRYDAVSGRVDCASCSTSGLLPKANPYLVQPTGFRRSPAENVLLGPRHRLSVDGEIVFATPESLVARDTNNEFDVYIWDGEPRLISSGTGISGAWPTAMTADGRSIFFIERSRLVAADDDNKVDLYVARVDGGIAAQQIPPKRGGPLCEERSCREEEPSPPTVRVPDTQRSTPATPAPSCKSEQRKLDRAERKAKRAQRKAHRKDRKVKKLRRKARRADGKRAHKLHKRSKAARRKAKRLDRKAGRADKREERATRRASRCLNGGAK